MKRVLTVVLIVLLMFSVCACSGTTETTQANTSTPEATEEPSTAAAPAPDPEPEPAQEQAPQMEFATEGTYTLFAVLNEGFTVESSELQMESDILLEEGGTGSMFFDGDSMDISQWVLDGDTISLTMSDGGQADAKLHDGILDLDLYGDGSMVLYYAQDGADISGYEYTTLEEVRQSTG